LIICALVFFILLVGEAGAQTITNDIISYYRSLGSDPNIVETTDMLKAADDWSNNRTVDGFTSPITTQQLLILADEWSSPASSGLLAGWWLPTWSEDDTNLNVDYTSRKSTLIDVTHVENFYNPFGVKIGEILVIKRNGEDFYGRGQNVTVGTLLTFHNGGVKPDSVVPNGTIIYPVRSALEGGSAILITYERSFNMTINYEYDEGYLKNGSGNEEFSGHISTSPGNITYSGNVTVSFKEMDGQIVWTEYIEKTIYSYENRPYAETVTVTTPQYEYLGGKWLTVREKYKTTTIYTDGNMRKSEIGIIWQRTEYGTTSAKNGSGIVNGSEVINGETVDYTGSIAIDYGLDSRMGWYKTGYNEKIFANAGLPKRLPFEVVFVDDLYLRPVFWDITDWDR
jgi:hypothetical protein